MSSNIRVHPIKILLWCSVIGASSLLPFNAMAADTSNGVVTKYQVDYFNKFTPQTLLDMIEKIPGTTSILNGINNGGGNRGFGSTGDQILINGKRVAGKNNSIGDELNRIQAKNVDHIQLIRGTVEGLDVRSDGLIINVILKDSQDSSTLWELTYRKSEKYKQKLLGLISHSGTTEHVKYTFGFERGSYPNAAVYSEVFTNSDNSLNHTRQEVAGRAFTSNLLNGKVDIDISDKTSLRLNGLYDWQDFSGDFIKSFHYAEPAINEPTDATDALFIDNVKDVWEFGGDLTHQFDTAGTLKLLFIANNQDFDGNLWIDRNEDAGEFSRNFTFLRSFQQSENIIRSTLNNKLSERHSLETGVELAINERNSVLVTEQSSTDSHDIKERRVEAFITHNFAISDKINLQSSLNNEWSTIKVTSHFANVTTPATIERSFSYPKPRVNLRYDYSDKDQFRVNLERSVSQLYLGDFVPNYNEEEKRIELTNSQLRPEKRWKLATTYQRQFEQDRGSISATLYYHRIEDYLTEIPFYDAQSVLAGSGRGNVDDASEYGIKLDGSLRLSAIGLDDTIISGDYTYRDGDTINPFTKRSKYLNFQVQNFWSATLKHDEVDLGFAFGVTLRRQSAERYNRYDYQARYTSGINGEAFMEYKINSTLKLRFDVENMLQSKGHRTTVRHEGLYTQTPISRYEDRRTVRSRRYSLSLKGQF